MARRNLSLRGGDPDTVENAKTQLKEVMERSNNLEQKVDDLAEGYDQLAQSFGMGGFKVTRTASYSCLNEEALTAPMEEPEPSDTVAQIPGSPTKASTPPAELKQAPPVQIPAAPPSEALTQKIAAALAKDSREVEEDSYVVPVEERMNIVIVSSEVAPFSKSGGLADVCDKLGVALSRMGHRVMTVAPLYWRYEGAENTGARKEFGVFGQKHTVEYWRKWRETAPASPETGGVAFGVDHVFVQNGCYERHGMYGHNDDLMRFTVLSWAALEACFSVDCNGSMYGDDCIFLVNDWMVGLVPLIMTSHYRRYGCFENARTIFDIHNMGYCGNFAVCNPQDLGLPNGDFFDKLFHDRQIKLLKGGIELSDRVVTVSPSYRDEILTPEGGWGLQESCRGRFPHLDGVLNGIDESEWDPSTDHFLSAKMQGYDNFYSVDDLSGKKSCKLHIQSHLGLNQDKDVPVICFIGRLAYQKGIDLLEQVFPWLMNTNDGVCGNVQLIMMGSGEEKYASFLRNAEGSHKGKVAGFVGFTPELEHKILAGADILLMPSRYEPCGLPQMYAQKYGTVPIVHATGGLKDSVEQFCPFEETGTGWKFDRADTEGIQWGLWNALNTYKNFPESWDKLRLRCMKQDFSWDRSARRYHEIFKWAKMDPPFIHYNKF